VRVPATSANVGPGFDCLALALGLHDVVVAHVTASDGVTVKVSGEGVGELPTDGRNLVARSMYAALEVLGQSPDGLSVECYNEIPQERGLGSSAAATIAGILAARALVPDGMKLMSDRDVLTLAAKIEGHADNPAACLLGGFTITWTGTSGQEAVKLIPSADIQPVVYVPENRMRTSEARALLPISVALDDAQFNARHSALLVHAITTAPELLLMATEDRLHQPFRVPALPATERLLSSLRDSGIAAVLSGAGPSVLALGRGDWDPPAPPGWEAWRLEVDLPGAVVELI
jgi:homoserine kinase